MAKDTYKVIRHEYNDEFLIRAETLPLAQILKSLIFKKDSEYYKEIPNEIPHIMVFHDAAVAISAITRLIPGTMIHGGFCRDFVKLLSKIHYNKKIKEHTQYYLYDLDICFNHIYSYDINDFIKEEKNFKFLYNEFKFLEDIASIKTFITNDIRPNNKYQNIEIMDMTLVVGKNSNPSSIGYGIPPASKKIFTHCTKHNH